MYKDITAKINFYNMSKIKGENIVKSETLSDSDVKACYDKIKSIKDVN